jgi:hypothetical protein
MLADAASTFKLTVKFVSTMFAEDYARLSRPARCSFFDKILHSRSVIGIHDAV